ncbi:MAG: iron ABC transporter substrate-binding protein, partial [Anaerolineales bacterium]|nr:iron ABC transporter substrate-binding protein [Anaerolineales bacterium]
MRVRWNKVVPAMIAVLMLLAACTPAATQAPAPAATQPPAAAATEAPMVDPMADLIAAAQAEGMLTTIALPHDWCNYEAVFEGFKAKYPGIEVNELDPGAGSGEELEAIRANMGNPGPQAPDVIDVGLAFGPTAKDEGLIQPYMVATWDEIPDGAKD